MVKNNILNSTFYFQVRLMKGTAFWISPKRALTAFHTFKRAGLGSRQLDGSELIDVAMYVDNKTFFTENKWKIISYCKNRTEDSDIVVIERMSDLAIPRKGVFATADWSEHHKEMWKNKAFFVYGFTPSSRQTIDDYAIPEVAHRLSVQVELIGNSGKLKAILKEKDDVQADYGGMSGAPLFWSLPGHLSRVVGIVLDYKRGLKPHFVCADITSLTYWEPFKRANDAYINGIKLFQKRKWKPAKIEIAKSINEFGQVYYGEKRDCIPEFPELEKMIAIAEAQILLGQAQYAEALKKVEKYGNQTSYTD